MGAAGDHPNSPQEPGQSRCRAVLTRHPQMVAIWPRVLCHVPWESKMRRGAISTSTGGCDNCMSTKTLGLAWCLCLDRIRMLKLQPRKCHSMDRMKYLCLANIATDCSTLSISSGPGPVASMAASMTSKSVEHSHRHGSLWFAAGQKPFAPQIRRGLKSGSWAKANETQVYHH